MKHIITGINELDQYYPLHETLIGAVVTPTHSNVEDRKLHGFYYGYFQLEIPIIWEGELKHKLNFYGITLEELKP